MSEHSPGPWKVNSAQRGAYYITAGDGTGVATTFEPNQSMARLTGAPRPEANAGLIAATPDLLAAVEAMVREFQPFTLKPIGAPFSEARQQQDRQIAAHRAALAAIGKATGATP